MDVFFSMPCSSPLKQLQTSFQKPSGWGSPPTMTHKTVLLILHIFRYWLWLNTLMGRPKYIMSLFFLHKLQWTGILVRESTPLTSLLFSLMFPNRWEDPLVLNHHLRLDPSNITIPFSSRPPLSCEENNAASTTWRKEKHGHGSLLVSQSQTRPNQVSFSSFGLLFLHFGINFVLAHRALWLREYERLTSGYRNPKWLASSVHHTFAAETNTLIQATNSQGKKAMSSAKSCIHGVHPNQIWGNYASKMDFMNSDSWGESKSSTTLKIGGIALQCETPLGQAAKEWQRRELGTFLTQIVTRPLLRRVF